MKKAKLILFPMVALGSFFSLQAQSATCISSASEYEANRSQLPSLFQEIPVLLTTDSMLVTAGLKIRVAGNKLKLEGRVRKLGNVYTDESYIQKFCYDQNQVQVVLDNNKTYSVEMSNNRVTIEGFAFKKSSEAAFAKILEKIEAQSAPKNSATKSSQGVD